MLKEEKKEEGVRYKNPAEYEKYIRRTYDCMKADTYQVEISERLYYRADKLSELGQLCEAHTCHSVIRTTNVYEIEEQLHYNSIFWTSEAESAGFKAKA